MAFETMIGTSFGVVVGGPQPVVVAGAGALPQIAADDDAEGSPDAEGTVDGAEDPHAAVTTASTNRIGTRRRADIHDRVSTSVGTCRQARMATS